MSTKQSPSPKKKRQILVTAALPYGNGPIHIGHAVEYVQTDIWVRHMLSKGHDVTYICADDQHGSAIMVEAQNQQIAPEELVNKMRENHLRDFSGIGIGFDHYGATHCDENRILSNEIYYACQDKGHIITRTVQQLYDPVKEMFLADRFVIGDCPNCHAKDQYGDNCEVCGATYQAEELINPISRFSGSTPILRESEHYFFSLKNIQSYLKKWVETPDRTDKATLNKVLERFNDDLRDWNISRDGPYFGFEIPDAPGKFFYVWMDAPIGYMASTEQWCKKNKKDFAEIWRDNGTPPKYEIYHFIGKDIINFHCTFWPALLSTAGFRTPDAIFVHGFLTVNGKKMSKREGTFIKLETYLDHLSPEYLRYYFAAKLGSGSEDIDLNLEDFITRVNGDLVGKFINLASRTSPFIERYFDGKLADHLEDSDGLMQKFSDASIVIAKDFEDRRYGQAIRQIMKLADCANEYIAEQAPWIMQKDDSKREELHQVCTLSVNMFRTLMVYLDPVVPQLAERVWEFLNIKQPSWDQACDPLVNHTINAYPRLIERIDPKEVQSMVEASTIVNEKDKGQVSDSDFLRSPLSPTCSLEQLNSIDMRVARIIEANRVKGQPKITRLMVDIGDTSTREIYANINGHYTSSDLIGRLTIVVANLPSKEFSFGTSEAMILAASGNGDHEVFLLAPDTGSRPGMRLI